MYTTTQVNVVILTHGLAVLIMVTIIVVDSVNSSGPNVCTSYWVENMVWHSNWQTVDNWIFVDNWVIRLYC